ncbi:hypothetical protein [Orlajensenia leifsoniae]|uniref:Uncharacterized protein n=1 Tax=Orlajensenia leifsoniae TaxID=2561933 RepID=A0A4Y9QSK6_9MICO|nr:hypothetical protein [Leifsonia flava]TFV94868.1 hypothetical protein E4M00_17080 [Leifsonia flava]
MPDVFKILKDLELKATGLDEKTMQQQEGYFVAFRDIGLPIREEDFDHPYNPLGHAEVELPPPNTDPKDAPKTASEKAGLDPEKVYDDTLLAKISASQRAYVNTFMLTDAKLTMSPRYSVMPGTTKVSDTWWAIVTGANGIPKKLELSPELKQAYDDAQADLVDEGGEPTPRYEKYLEYSDAYEEALHEYATAYAEAATDPETLASFPLQGRYARKQVDKAWDRWNSLGSKERVEAALNTLAAQGVDPAMALISRAEKKLSDNLLDFPGVGLLPLTTVSPSSWSRGSDDRGWNKYTSADFHSETHYTESSTSINANAGLNLGFWSVGGSLASKNERASMQGQTDNLEVSFEYMIADIQRPWLSMELLNLKNWFLYGDYDKNAISSGTMAQEKPTDGSEPLFLPSVITSLILVKDIHIKWANWKSDWNAKTSSLEAGASVGWGPFAVSGSYGSKKHSLDATTDNESEGLTVEGIQLIGYVSQITPASPKEKSSTYMTTPNPAEPPTPIG